MLGVSLLVASLGVTSANANIFTTNPVASTVWTAGHNANIAWTNDNTIPSLKDMGPVSIELFANASVHVATLASGVRPGDKFKSIYVSPSFGVGGGDYHLRFVCKDPPITVYSADFEISGSGSAVTGIGTSSTGLISNTRNANLAPTTTSSGARVVPLLTISLPDTTVTVIPTPATSSNGTSNASKTSTSSSTTTDESKPTQRTSSSNNALGRRLMVDHELFKFRFIFILWPALMGLMMAF